MTGREAFADLEPHPDTVVRNGVRYGVAVSADERFRYQLTRIWDDTRDPMLWIMLNPSTADAATDDPTIRRCIAFARSFGQSGIVVRNLFALRATDPDMLREVADPVGPFGDHWLTLGLHPDESGDIGEQTWTPEIVCAWGSLAARGQVARERAAIVRATLAGLGHRVHHLGLTQDGNPRHPLYLRGDAQPTVWPPDTPGDNP